MNEMTDEVQIQTFHNDFDGEEEATIDTAGFQTAQDGEDKSATHNNSTGMNETVGFQTMNDRVNEESASHSSNMVMADPFLIETIQDKGIEELRVENTILKTLLDSLRNSIVEAKDNSFIHSCAIKSDTPLYVQHRQIQEIFNTFKKMESEMKILDRQLFNIFSLVGDGLDYKVVATGRPKRMVYDPPDEENDMYQRTIFTLEKMKQTQLDGLDCTVVRTGMVYDPPDKEDDMYQRTISTLEKMKQTQLDIKRLEDENNRLESLMSCLQKYIYTGTEAKHTFFELPSEISPDSAVASSYKAAQAIWHKFVKMNRSKDNVTKKNNKLIMSVEDMDQSLSRKKETVMKLRNRIKLLESDIQSIRTVNEELQTGYEKLQKMNYNIMARENETVSHIQSRENSLILEINSIVAVNKQLHDDCHILQGQRDVLTENLEQCKNSLTMMQIQMTNHQRREIQFKAAYDAEVMKTENQQKQIDGLQLKSDDLLNRLSKLAGDRLIHENTNIADLSDTNRPTKLAEAYSELYDNEWTDAFEELISRNLTDEEAVGKLLDMLLMSFHKCREITWERYRSLQSIISTIDIHVFACARGFPEGTKPTVTQSELSSHKSNNTNVTINLEASYEEHHVCTATMSFDQEMEIKRIWRTTTTALREEAVKHLHSVLLTKCDVSIDAFPKTSKYLAICIDLCWKMGVQERPMHLDADVETGDSSEKMLDLNKFRLYTKTGKRVAFVVWPALFIHEGGPMLVKGIAQGCNEKD